MSHLFLRFRNPKARLWSSGSLCASTARRSAVAGGLPVGCRWVRWAWWTGGPCAGGKRLGRKRNMSQRWTGKTQQRFLVKRRWDESDGLRHFLKPKRSLVWKIGMWNDLKLLGSNDDRRISGKVNRSYFRPPSRQGCASMEAADCSTSVSTWWWWG